MSSASPLSPDEQARRARFIRRWGVWRFGVPSAIAWALLTFAWRHDDGFQWSMLWSPEFFVKLAIALVGFGWFAGRWWGALIYDMMPKLGMRPPEE